MDIPDRDQFKFANNVGHEAFQLIIKRTEALGPQSFDVIFSAVVGSAAVCLANALRPAIEKPETPEARAALADRLIATCSTQVRTLVDPAVKREAS